MPSNVSIAFGCPRLGVASEVWLTRMIEYLRPDVRVILTYPDTRAFLGIPCVGSEPDYWRRSRLYRGYARARDSLSGGWHAHAARALRKARPTHVLLNYITTAMATRPIWDGLDAPVLVHCHGFDVTADARRDDNPAVPLHAPGYEAAVRELAGRVRFIANSEWTRGRLLALGVPEGRIHLKYFGVETVDISACRRSGGEEVRILFVGRLVDFKGPDCVIRAFCLACDRGMKGRLIVAGDGPMRPACELLRMESRHADRIEMRGEVDRAAVAALMGESDVFTAHHWTGPISRREEAFGVAVIEAMGWGLPVVCGRSGGVPEIVEDGTSGLLIEPGDVEAHADAFLRLAGSVDLRRQLGKGAQDRVSTKFTIDAERRRMYEILEDSTRNTT